MSDKALLRRLQINYILQEVSDYWHDHPELRLGQLISNALPATYGNDPYYFTDAALVAALYAETDTEGTQCPTQ